MPRLRRAEVVSYTVHPEGVVVVTVECPTCRVGQGRNPDSPKRHTHGWTRLTGEDGGPRAPHCASLRAPSYELHWTGGPPADVTEALRRRDDAA